MAASRRRVERVPSARAGDRHGRVPDVDGIAVLDVGLTDRVVLDAVEPSHVVRAAAEWSGLMDGRLELRDGAVTWVPGEYARRFGFIEFRLEPEQVTAVRVDPRPTMRGVVDIDLTDGGTVAVRVPDPDRWRDALARRTG